MGLMKTARRSRREILARGSITLALRKDGLREDSSSQYLGKDNSSQYLRENSLSRYLNDDYPILPATLARGFISVIFGRIFDSARDAFISLQGR